MRSYRFVHKNKKPPFHYFLFDTFFVLTACCVVLFEINCKKKNDSQNVPYSSSSSLSANALPTETIQIADQIFSIELAYTKKTRELGLMYRRSLEPNNGMLFIFDKPNVLSFHMANCLIDLDILFLDETGKIVHFITMTAPPPGRPSQIYSSQSPAKYALELPAGTTKNLDLQIGQSIPLPSRIKNIIPE